MAKKITYRCLRLRLDLPSRVGQCRECGAWAQIDQAGRSRAGWRAAPRRPRCHWRRGRGRAPRRSAGRGRAGPGPRRPGIVPGAVILPWPANPAWVSPRCCWTWPPKAARTAASEQTRPSLYVTGESSAQVRGRQVSERSSRTLIADETELGASRPWGTPRPPGSVLLSSSTPCRQSPHARSKAGRAASPRCAQSPPPLIRVAKSPTYHLLVGHVTKDGGIAGPARPRTPRGRRLPIERPALTPLLLRAVKTADPTDEVGFFS